MFRKLGPLSLTLLLGCGTSQITGDGRDLAGTGGDDLSASALDLFGLGDGGAGCSGSSECSGGVCVSGTCCAPSSVCGATCCGAGTVCLFDQQCVTPGKPCHTANDCGKDQYCEPGLGMAAPDGGTGDGGTCTQPLPVQGRCLPLPPRCDADAGVTDGGCAAPCEYHPMGGGPLNAVAKWTWGAAAKQFPNFVDVWSTPTVGRVADSNCDGKVDLADPPNIIFVAGNVAPTNTPRNNGVLRVLDGRTGEELWSLRRADPNSIGFMGFSVAIGDIDSDGAMDIVAVTGEKYVALIDAAGTVKRISDKPIPSATDGWGGGPAIGDMDNDGFPEIAFGATVYTTKNKAITLRWTGPNGTGGGANQELSTLVDLDGLPDSHLELLAGKTAYRADGSVLWNTQLPDGFPGVGDFNKDGRPEAVLVANGQLWLLDGPTGAIVLGPLTLPGTGSGGPPTVADFDGDGKPEIGVAMATFYSVIKPDFMNKKLNVLWQRPNHDLSSSVTGSSVFDFEGDGRAEVIYGDECYLWVFDGQTGNVRFATSTTSFTATETSVVADVDGDGRAELLMISNGASPVNWGCLVNNNPVTVNGVKWIPGPANNAYRGVTVFGDKANSWVGTRTLWNEHTYHVSNICDDRDTACDAPNLYGSIPKVEKRNWNINWLNNFRQNVQDRGLFDAPDAIVSLTIDCTDPVVARPTVRNAGLASLPAGVQVAVYLLANMGQMLVGTATTTHPLAPGQGEQLPIKLMPGPKPTDTYRAEIVIDPQNPTFHQCRDDNDRSDVATANCIQ